MMRRFRSSASKSLPDLPHLKVPEQTVPEQQVPAPAPAPAPGPPRRSASPRAARRGGGRCPFDVPAYARMPKTWLQQHVSFWDRNKTGVIYPWNSYDGFRALGFSLPFSLVYALAFHILHTSYWTTTGFLINPLFPVYVENIHRAKHGSDTGTYDHDGNFQRDSFEQIFQRYDKGKKGGLTYTELVTMMYGNRCAGDLLGWSFSFFLWSALWLLVADPTTGVVSKQDIWKHYSGELYYEIEERRKQGDKLSVWRFGALWG